MLAQNGKTAGEIFETLMVEDVSAACELFFPIYDRSNFVDGLVTVPISPHLAHDTGATVAEARRAVCRSWLAKSDDRSASHYRRDTGDSAIDHRRDKRQRHLAFLGGRLSQGRGSVHSRLEQ